MIFNGTRPSPTGISILCVGNRLQGAPFDARSAPDLSRLAHSLQLPLPWRQAEQIHGDAIDLDGSLTACDAFLVRSGEAALVRHADCFPVVIHSPVAAMAIIAHCGWKGTKLGLTVKAVAQLVALGCDPTDLFASIGPGIGPGSFEVGPDLLEQFDSEFHSHTLWGTASIDLPAALKRQLLESGLSQSQIEISPIDTFTDPSYHSYRRQQELSGRNATICIVPLPPQQETPR